MAIRCLVSGHSTTSGEEKIEVEELWHNPTVYYCKRCDGIVVDPSQGNERVHEKILEAANQVLENENKYNDWTVEAANEALSELQ